MSLVLAAQARNIRNAMGPSEDGKSQILKSKFQIYNSKFQILKFRILGLFGAWDLGFSTFSL